MSLVSRCLEDMGFDEIEEWFEMGMEEGGPLDSVMIGACTDPDCDGITQRCEPDATRNYCETCHQKTVKSLAVLTGLL